VPKGDEESPPIRKKRPAVPPSPTSPVTPVQNATSSKLDVGLSRGQFEMPGSRRLDLGGSSGFGGARIHQTKPITASSKSPRKEHGAAETAAGSTKMGAEKASGSQKRPKLWLGLVLALMIALFLLTLIGYYVYYKVWVNE
jgi:hypothetical protein